MKGFLKKICSKLKKPQWNDDKNSRILFLAVCLFAVAAVVNFYAPKGPAWLYVTLYCIATALLILYMLLSFRNRRKK